MWDIYFNSIEWIEVEQGFLASLIELAQKPFLNSKKEEKEEDVKVDDDEMEYEGKKYSKKELVNCYKSKMNEAEEEKEDKEEEKEKTNATEEEEVEDDMEMYNSMKTKLETRTPAKRVLPQTHNQMKTMY